MVSHAIIIIFLHAFFQRLVVGSVVIVAQEAVCRDGGRASQHFEVLHILAHGTHFEFVHQVYEVFGVRGERREQTEGAEEVFVGTEGIAGGLEVADAPFVDKRHALVVQVVHVRREAYGFDVCRCRLVESARFQVDVHSLFRSQLEVGFGIGRAGEVVVYIPAFGHGGEELSQGGRVVFDILEIGGCGRFILSVPGFILYRIHDNSFLMVTYSVSSLVPPLAFSSFL